jgi:hypothetical protein
MIKYIIFLFLSFSFFFTSCKFNKQRINDEVDKNEAERVIDDFYNLLGQKKIDSARMLFHPSLLAANDSVKFREFLTNVSNQVPFIKERKLDHWQTVIITGLDAGNSYSFYYVNKYEGGLELKISVRLQKDGLNNLKILSYNASPDKFD